MEVLLCLLPCGEPLSHVKREMKIDSVLIIHRSFEPRLAQGGKKPATSVLKIAASLRDMPTADV
jgi:hypothetical protein